jgi:FixJ family two-component response regulator
VSGTIDEEHAVDLMHNGAQDFVRKTNLSRLMGAIDRELRNSRTRAEKKQAEERVETERRLAGAQYGVWIRQTVGRNDKSHQRDG